jgi:TonB-linked SusC/RagA family outer membrane protein
MKKNQKKSKKLMSSSILLLGLFSFFVTSAISVNAEVATRKLSLAQITVTGKVTDSRNTPLDGISVAVKGSKTAVITDAKGMFTISVPDNGTLVFSAVGFISSEVAVKNNKVINVFLTEQVSSLSDVVVVGYGTAKKKDLTGAVVQIKATQLENENARSIQDMLRGNAPGLDVGFSASPKGGGSLQVRGRASLTASTSPLLVLDGVIYPGDLADINPNDIATMDVLKDASSAAVFGARSANGVILITTKRGKMGKPIITVNSNYTMNRIASWPGLLSPDEFLSWRQDVRYSMRGYDSTSKPGMKYFEWDPRKLPNDFTVNQWLGLSGQLGADPVTTWLQRLGGGTGTQPVSIQSYKDGKPIDWESLILNKNGMQQDHTVGISGRTQNTTYYTSLGYFENQGMSNGEIFKTFRSRLNLETEIAKYLTFGLNMQFASRDEGQTPVSIGDMLNTSPFGDLYQADGRLRASTNDDVGNNLNPLVTPYYVKRLIKFNNLFGSVYVKGKLPLGFSYQVNYTPRFEWAQNYEHISSQRPLLESRGGITTRTDNRTFQWQVDNLLM